MQTFITENFLLQTKTSRLLYFDYVKDLPIIDYHNHLSPSEISTDKKFANLTQAWLNVDHYKWRAMRTNGIDESFITGNADDLSKFKAWAATVPFTMRNPLYHWSHLELQQLFGIEELLDENNSEKIYHQCNEMLQAKFSVQEILKHYKVEMLCTTDNATDDLQFHQKLKKENFEIKVLPAFRPDILLDFENINEWFKQVELLSSTTNISINNLDDFLSALENRIEFFHSNGCCLSDHGLAKMPDFIGRTKEIENTFIKLLDHTKEIDFSIFQNLKAYILFELCKIFQSKKWVQQFHLGALRNTNSRLLKSFGKDAGTDSIGDFSQAKTLAKFLDALDKKNYLTKTILYNLNPSYNEVFATLAGNFNDGTVAGKMQWGSAWWFLDQKDGIEKQLNTLSNMSLLSRFVGMVTDSRSFLSFSRHDYFRRILCNLIGNNVENGELPNDINFLGKMCADISYHNAKNYFNWKS